MDVSIRQEFPLTETVYTLAFLRRFHLEEKVEIKQLLLLVWAEMLGY